MSYNPVEGLKEIEFEDIRPGDEIVWTWKATQLNDARYYVHTTVPVIDGKTEREIQRQMDEFNLIVVRNRKFFLVSRP